MFNSSSFHFSYCDGSLLNLAICIRVIYRKQFSAVPPKPLEETLTFLSFQNLIIAKTTM